MHIAEELLKTWTSRMASDDLCMTEDLSPEVQIGELKSCVDEFGPKMQNNRWIQTLLDSL
jgi:DNA mismatch repair protein MSH2